MKRIYSVLVENRAGVLSKVSGLFSRRNFNIDSLVVGETADKSVSCMTIVSSGDERTIEQIEKQLNKKIDVIKVKTFKESLSINRELMLIKVKYNKENSFIEMLRSVSIVEIARTGTVALTKCKEQ